MKPGLRLLPRLEQPASWRQPPTWRAQLRTLPLVVAVSTIAGLLVCSLNPGVWVVAEIALSNLVGLLVWSGSILIRTVSRHRLHPMVAGLLAAVPAMLLVQPLFSVLVGGESFSAWLHDPRPPWRSLTTGLLLTFAALVFILRDRAANEYRASLEAQLRQVAEARQGEALARLALLQAQIEPHFLFNTLANVQSMIEREPRTAARMLDHLNRYLRAALGRTRGPSSTCGEEMELIGALLAIAEIRLGGRLRYTLQMPAELKGASLPPLLLQPLVENALKHGIEPAVGGGEIVVACGSYEGRLVLTVCDTGMGFREGAPAGVGLSNVRARLASLYGAHGQLTLQRHAPRGTLAEIRLPLTQERA